MAQKVSGKNPGKKVIEISFHWGLTSTQGGWTCCPRRDGSGTSRWRRLRVRLGGWLVWLHLPGSAFPVRRSPGGRRRKLSLYQIDKLVWLFFFLCLVANNVEKCQNLDRDLLHPSGMVWLLGEGTYSSVFDSRRLQILPKELQSLFRKLQRG